MKIAIGTDHRGFEHKEIIQKSLPNIAWHDVGAYTAERSDYPEFVIKVCNLMLNQTVAYGILLCGTGVGMSIAANRFPNIYAALVWNEAVARASREDDNSNVLVLPADYISPEQSIAIITAWLNASFKGGRYKDRLDMIDRIRT